MSPREIYMMLQVIGIVLIVAELFYVAFQKPSNLQKHLIILFLTIGISFVGYLIELMGQDIQTSYIGVCVGYLGKPFALISALLLFLEYSNIKVKKGIVIAVLLYLIFLTSMVITNPYHHLYYKNVGFDFNNIGSPLVIKSADHGIFWYMYMATSFVIFFLFCAVVIYEYRHCKNRQARQMAILLFLVVFFAFLGLFLFIFGLTYSYDTTLVGILIGVIIFVILMSKYRMFDTLTLAQSKSLDELNDGIIVLDARDVITYKNQKAISLLPELESNNRKKEAKVLQQIESFDKEQALFIGDNVYTLSIDIVTAGKKNKIVGKRYCFKEITEHYYYQEQLSKDVDLATKKIKHIQRKTLFSLAEIIEARDTNTGEHVKHVSDISYKIALQLKNNPKYKDVIDESNSKILKECAPLHDIGKLYVSDTILNKPGKLTPEEFEIMKIHTIKGGEIIDQSLKGIEESNYVRIAKEIAVSHHERWDGTGYPKGLKGEKIPLSARIVAVADVYDALRMKRPYKESLSKAISISIIKKESGTHFDPDVVNAFIDISKKLS